MRPLIPWWSNCLAPYCIGLEHSIGQYNVSMGKVVSDFESQLASYYNSDYACCFSSGTAALSAALVALRKSSADSIYLPNRTWIGTANAAAYMGHPISLYDSLKGHQNGDPSDLERAIHSSKTTAKEQEHSIVIWVPVNGSFAGLEEIISVCKAYRLPLLVDACQSFASNKNAILRLLESGALVAFSFGMPKIISTGLGGCILGNLSRVEDRLRSVRNQGISEASGLVDQAYGFNLKYTDIQAFIGLQQLLDLDNIISRHKSAISIYSDILRLPFVEGSHLACLAEDEIPLRAEIYMKDPIRFQGYMKACGIEVSLRTDNISSHPLYQSIDHSNLVNSLAYCNSIVVLPSGPGQRCQDLEYVRDCLLLYNHEQI